MIVLMMVLKMVVLMMVPTHYLYSSTERACQSQNNMPSSLLPLSGHATWNREQSLQASLNKFLSAANKLESVARALRVNTSPSLDVREFLFCMTWCHQEKTLNRSTLAVIADMCGISFGMSAHNGARLLAIGISDAAIDEAYNSLMNCSTEFGAIPGAIVAGGLEKSKLRSSAARMRELCDMSCITTDDRRSIAT